MEERAKRTKSEAAILVRSFGSRRKMFESGDETTVEYLPGETVQGLLERLKVRPDEAWLILVNGVRVEAGYILRPGDVVSVICPIEGG